jgi:hypothetical protein
MAGEASIRVSLQINKAPFRYQSQPTSFAVDVANARGPSPGYIKVTDAVTTVDFSTLTQPGVCRVTNLSDTYIVEVGIKVPGTSKFHPLMEILPNDFSPLFRISRNLGEEEDYPGTGTTAEINSMGIRAVGAPSTVDVLVEAFDS